MRNFKFNSARALTGITVLLENLLAWCVLLTLLIYGANLLYKYITHPALLWSGEGMRSLLADALLLAMGAEFVRTFLQHTPQTIVEILSFAIARHIVLDPGSMLEVLAGSGAVFILMVGYYFLSRPRALAPAEANAPTAVPPSPAPAKQ